MSANMSSNELMQRIHEGAVVVDVMTPEEYATCHVTGAKNACIYEMAFLDHIAEQIPDRNTELIVYDATDTTRSAGLARERLQKAGYTNVSVLAGGLAAWRNAGLPVEADELAVVTELELRDGTYRLDKEKCTLEWIGRNLNKRHYGRIAIQTGELAIAEGRLTAGNIVLDMTTISNLDLQDETYRRMLVNQPDSLVHAAFGQQRHPGTVGAQPGPARAAHRRRPSNGRGARLSGTTPRAASGR